MVRMNTDTNTDWPESIGDIECVGCGKPIRTRRSKRGYAYWVQCPDCVIITSISIKSPLLKGLKGVPNDEKRSARE